MERIPVLTLGPYLLVTLQGELKDQTALALQEDLTTQIRRTGARGALIDISGVDMIDSFIGRVIASTASMARILDAHTVVVGIRPAVAITLVELGVELVGVLTALTVERGIEVLRSEIAKEARVGSG